jgi:RimJ/RimL family protein N-acetyltransferase
VARGLATVPPGQVAALRPWFVPERPGPLVGLHVINTGNGSLLADRWPRPRAVLAEVAGNWSLAGDPDALEEADLRGLLAGFVEAPARFLPLLRAAFADLVLWDRLVFALGGRPRPPPAAGGRVRRLRDDDAGPLGELGEETAWVAKTWGGPAGLAASGTGWGAFAGGRPVSVACPFFVGERYEDVGVATEPGFRGAGLSTACAAAVCADILERGRAPSWTTSPDNLASLRVAEKLGFSAVRRDRLYVVGVPVP